MSLLDRPLHFLTLALGIAAGGALAGEGLARGRLGDRYATVKGVSGTVRVVTTIDYSLC
jgi:hypothetical protein